MFGNFNFDRFLFSLQYMWQGMFCIFVVILAIIISVALLNKFTSGKSEKKE